MYGFTIIAMFLLMFLLIWIIDMLEKNFECKDLSSKVAKVLIISEHAIVVLVIIFYVFFLW